MFILTEINSLLFLLTILISGLIGGRLLNILIYEIPIIMEQGWQDECRNYLHIENLEPINIKCSNSFATASNCPECQRPIKFWERMPLLGFLLMNGRCPSCQKKISAREPIIEILTAVLSVLVALKFGYSLETFAGLILTWSLIVISFIDLDHQLILDNMTYPLTWIGLFLSVLGLFTDSTASILGAIGAYLSLWVLFHIFRIATGKEGMGYGDFKLFAMFGAWLGWSKLPLILLISSLAGAISGLIMILAKKHDQQTPIPFGPYLAIAGWIALIWGNEIIAAYWSISSP